MTTPKPKIPKVNVFLNDGSFLERFHKFKRDELEGRRQEEILQRKRNFDTRFKNRGKRPPPVTTAPSSSVISSDEDGTRPPKRSRPNPSEGST